MKCSKCGKDIAETDHFCSNCGEVNDRYNPDGSSNPEDSYGYSNGYGASGGDDIYTSRPTYQNESYGVKPESPALGILSIVFAFIWPFVGMILGIVGLAKLKEKPNRTKCIIGLVLSVVFLVIYIVLVVVTSGGVSKIS